MSNYSCTNNHCGPCMPQPCPQPNCCPQPCPQPAPCSDCPCGENFRRALNLLCCPPLSAAVNFDSFALISDYYILGSAIGTAPCNNRPGDNLCSPCATYTCGGDGCETISVSGPLYPPCTSADPLCTIISQAALCSLKAVSFDAASGGDPIDNFQLISQTLSQMLRPCHCQPCPTCLPTALTNAAASHAVTVVVGPLVVENSTILGQIGNVLVLSNATDNRFYFICANAIDFIG